MATLTITSVRPVRFENTDHKVLPTGEAVTIGQYIRHDSTTGKWALGNATTAAEVGYGGGFIADHTAAVGEAVTGWKAPAILDVGEALAGLSYGQRVYLSDTDGTLADAAGTVSTLIGVVIPAFGNTTAADKLLQLV